MHELIKKLGFGDRLAAIIMIVFGILIIYKPELLSWLVAAYLIIVGILKIVVHK